MSAQIPNLPAAAAITATTLFETVDPAGTNVSEKATFQKILDFISANGISIGGGVLVINPNGSASFSSGDLTINTSGDLSAMNLFSNGGFSGSIQVLTALPTTFSTVTFAGGICTGVTTP